MKEIGEGVRKEWKIKKGKMSEVNVWRSRQTVKATRRTLFELPLLLYFWKSPHTPQVHKISRELIHFATVSIARVYIKTSMTLLPYILTI